MEMRLPGGRRIHFVMTKDPPLRSHVAPHLDFTHECCFREQIEHIGEGIRYGDGETVRVPMQSGRVALYRLTSEVYNPVFEDTGQRNWHFEFLRYADEGEA